MNELPRRFHEQTPHPDEDASLLPQKSVSLAKIFHVMVKRRVVLATTTLACLAIGIVYVAITPASYTASASLMIDTKKMPWFQTQTTLDSSTMDDGAVESQIETIRSEQVALSVIKSLELVKDPEFVGSGRSLMRSLWAALGLNERSVESDQALQRAAVESFKSHLRIIRVAHSYVADISFTSLNREKAAKIANATADAYIEDQLQARFAVAKRASVWLQERIKELREQATSSFKAIQDFKSENNVIIGSDGKLVTELEQEQLANDLARARAETTAAQAKSDRIQALIASHKGGSYAGLPDPSIVDAMNNSIIQKLRETVLEDQKQMAEVTAKYGPQHQAALNLHTEIDNLNASIWNEMDRIAESMKSDLHIAKQREDSLSKRMTEVFNESRSTRQAQVQLQELTTASNTYRTIYENFLDKYTQAVQQQSFPATEARLITYATPPTSKSSPKTALTLVLALFAGLASGVGLALLREQLDRVIHTRDQLMESAHLTCIAMIPYNGETSTENNGAAARIAKLWRAFIGSHDKADIEARKAPVVLVKPNAPLSAQSEALRAVKVSIDLQRLSRTAKVIGITSSLAGEGKSTIAASLVTILAESHKSTILIDADMRNPTLTNMLGAAGEPGLLDLLTCEVEPDLGAFVRHDARGFDFLAAPTKVRPANTADVLASERMHHLLGIAGKSYDYVIVDLPPLLPVVDVRASAHRFDAFIMVVEWGRTTMDEVSRAMRQSDHLAKNTIGAVFNKVDPSAVRRYEGYGYAGSSYGPYG